MKYLYVRLQSETTYCFGCKDYTQNFRSEKVKMTTKCLEKNFAVFFVDLISQDFFLKNKLTPKIIKIRWRLIAWSVEKILKILTIKWSEQMIID